MTISDKLLTIANNTPAVAEAVHTAKATVSGTTIRVDDVLDVEHPLQVQVRSKNLLDYTKATGRTAAQKVEIVDDGVIWKAGGDYYFVIPVSIPVNTTVTCSWVSGNDAGEHILRWVFMYTDETYSTYTNYTNGTSHTSEKNVKAIGLYKHTAASALTQDLLVSNIQLEYGSVATAYTPYMANFSGKNLFNIDNMPTDPAYSYVIAQADGTILVDGVRGKTPALSCGKTLRELVPGLKAGETYALSAVSAVSGRAYIYLQGYNKVWYFYTSLTMTDAILDSKVFFYTNSSEQNIISNLQIEEGNTVTAYAPYTAGVNITRYGKNLANVADITEPIVVGSWRTEQNTNRIFTNFKENTQYTISCEVLTNTSDDWVGWQFYYTDGTNNYSAKSDQVVVGTTKLTSIAGKTVDHVLVAYATGGYSITARNIQLEMGTEATAYEPYQEPQTITANADGKATGLLSVSPTMTLLTDSAGVSVECTYFPQSAADIYGKYKQIRQQMVNLSKSIKTA